MAYEYLLWLESFEQSENVYSNLQLDFESHSDKNKQAQEPVIFYGVSI